MNFEVPLRTNMNPSDPPPGGGFNNGGLGQGWSNAPRTDDEGMEVSFVQKCFEIF